jgi:hypothetical protein
LVREGIAVPDANHATATVRIGGGVQRVLRLRNSAIQSLIGEELQILVGAVTKVTAVTGNSE